MQISAAEVQNSVYLLTVKFYLNICVGTILKQFLNSYGIDWWILVLIDVDCALKY